jgi:hypothetical protein
VVAIRTRLCRVKKYIVAQPLCEYCRHSTDLGNGEMICMRRGIVPRHYFCRRFRYDPFRREPETRGVFDSSKFSAADFSLE